MDTAKYVLGAFTLALVAIGLVVGLMPVRTHIYDCGAPLGADHAQWEAHDVVNGALNDLGGTAPATKDASCTNRVSGPRTIAIALFAGAGALVVGQIVIETTTKREAASETAAS